MPSNTKAVNLSLSVLTFEISTPSFSSLSFINLPICSLPTLVIKADFNPNLEHPILILVGLPPTYFEKFDISSNFPPTCCP